ncbi:MAG: alpha/beta fold hydrolase [Mesorhizobium sp.]|nr:alpha/beta fold hydrolase [Mesorhizobium sp.]
MVFAHERPLWSVEGRDWPNREASRFVVADGLSWHVQDMGRGPGVLLLHGTGAATHSFRDLAPLLGRDFRVVAPDLPGHGFTQMPSGDGLSLPGMARLLADLLSALDFHPDIVVGHSAGAAILFEMALRGMIHPWAIVAINGALLPIRGASLFSPLAKLLFLNPVAPKLFAWRALGRDATRRLLVGTGSTLDERGVDLYERLFRKSGHIAATLGMMASWDLDRFERRMPGLSVPLVLVTSAGDKAVPPADAHVVAAHVKGARIVALARGGHLVHEEEPAMIAGLIVDMARDAGLFELSSI